MFMADSVVLRKSVYDGVCDGARKAYQSMQTMAAHMHRSPMCELRSRGMLVEVYDIRTEAQSCKATAAQDEFLNFVVHLFDTLTRSNRARFDDQCVRDLRRSRMVVETPPSIDFISVCTECDLRFVVCC